MKNKKFKKGDKVRAIDNRYAITCKVRNWEGIVAHVWDDGNFDAVTTKHIDSSEIDEEYYGLNPKHFELITPETIVITSDGKTTTAYLKQGKKTVKQAIAKCSPDDEFSLEIGAKLALNRLFEVECVKQNHYQVGDRVRIVKEKTGKCWNPWGEMDEWLGKTMTITDTRENKLGCYYKMKEDAGEWSWYPWMIAEKRAERK